jgi:WD40 repeat protein
VLTFKAHKKPIFGLCFAPDGRFLATSARNEPVQLWSLDNQARAREFHGTYFDPFLAFSPDGRFFARGGNEFDVWDLRSSERLLTNDSCGQAIAFSPDNKEFATFGSDEPLKRWSLPSGKELSGGWGGKRTQSQFPAGALAYSPDGTVIATCFGVFGRSRFSPHLLLWNRKTGKLIQTIGADFKFDYPKVIAYSPDGSAIVGDYGPVLGVVAVANGEKVAALKPGKKHFNGFAFTPDGKRLIAVNNDATVRVYDTASWNELTGYEWQIGRLTAVAVAPDGLRAVCGSNKGQVVVWDLG